MVVDCFPTTNTYLICWLTGTNGGFITSLVGMFLNKINKIHIGEYGSAHWNLNIERFNWNRIKRNVYLKQHLNKTPVYEFITPDNIRLDLILFQHLEVDFDKLFSIYPKCKVIIIKVDEKDVEIVVTNYMKKFVLEGSKLSDHGYKRYIDLLKSYNLKDFDLDFLIKENTKNFKLPNFYNSKNEVIRDNVYTINFSDITSNPDKVLGQLSQITSKPITNSIKENYTNYINLQQ